MPPYLAVPADFAPELAGLVAQLAGRVAEPVVEPAVVVAFGEVAVASELAERSAAELLTAPEQPSFVSDAP